MERSNKKDELQFFSFQMYDEIAWLAPIRTKPRRTYDEYKYDFTPEGEHTPYIIKRILKSKTERNNFLRFAKRIGKNSGLFENISVKNYGKSSTSSFELDVELSKKTLSINSVGYGISQALPVIVEMFSRPNGTRFAIQQPEVHLHPRAQAAFGSTIFELALSDNKRFFIETHSDYLIDRFRINMRNSKRKNKPDSQIIFFERSKRGNKLHILPIASNGDIATKQPKKYRDFFVKEEFSVLGID